MTIDIESKAADLVPEDFERVACTASDLDARLNVKPGLGQVEAVEVVNSGVVEFQYWIRRPKG